MIKPLHYLIFLFLALASISLQAQMRGNLASSVGISGGYVEDGFGVMGTFNFQIGRASCRERV